MAANASRAGRLRQWLMMLEDYPVILAPVSVQPTAAFDADLKGDAEVYRFFQNDLRFVGALSVLGLPVATTPAGLTAKGHPGGRAADRQPLPRGPGAGRRRRHRGQGGRAGRTPLVAGLKI